MDKNGVRALLQRKIHAAGTQRALAEQFGVSQQFINDVLHGRREPSNRMLELLGLEREVVIKVKRSA